MLGMYTSNKLLADIEEFVFNKGKELKKEVLLKVDCDSFSLSQEMTSAFKSIITQLVTNALIHGLESSEQRHHLGKTEKPMIEIQALSTERCFIITVTDNGRGIQDLEQCLTFGHSSADSCDYYSGRGVGLSVVHSTVKSLGGRLLVSSDLNNGSIFKVVIPKF
ncbi:MAG: hypothetical protein KC478_14480 [Bacteriovoracaceae bacterium]|nr:hypothetical protein [Bacteriovoracaceae bacterium]